MTACLYISPPFEPGDESDSNIFPVLIADTLVSLTGLAAENPLLPVRGRTNDMRSAFSTKLYRKLIFLDGCTMALSGSGEAIREVVLHVKDQLPDWLKEERPMRRLSDYLSGLNRHYGYAIVQGLGVHQNENGNVNFCAPLDGRRRFHHLGFSVAHGSGQMDLMEYASEMDHHFTNWDLTDVNPFVKANALVNTLNGRKLCREMVLGKENGWGGFLEWAYVSPGSNVWEIGPSVLHVLLYFEAEGTSGPDKRNIMLAYDPNIGGGSLACLNSEAVSLFTLDKIIETKDNTGSPKLSDWNGWNPDFIVVSVLDPNSSDGKMIANKTLNIAERKYVTIEFAGDHVSVRTDFPAGDLSSIFASA